MKGFIARLVATGVAFVVTAWVVPQIHFPATKFADPVHDIITIAAVAFILGLVNALIKPAVKLLSLPMRMATLGLISFVINGGLLLLVAWLASKMGIAFRIGEFPHNLLAADTIIGAIVGAVVLGIVGALVGMFVKD